ncbi:hypothetical protein ACRRTK_000438 [Alexandromys fortis]
METVASSAGPVYKLSVIPIREKHIGILLNINLHQAMKGDRDRDPQWSTGLKSQGPNQKQEREHKQGTQDREGCTHTLRQWG